MQAKVKNGWKKLVRQGNNVRQDEFYRGWDGKPPQSECSRFGIRPGSEDEEKSRFIDGLLAKYSLLR